jgi:hypothetical protein
MEEAALRWHDALPSVTEILAYTWLVGKSDSVIERRSQVLNSVSIIKRRMSQVLKGSIRMVLNSVPILFILDSAIIQSCFGK